MTDPVSGFDGGNPGTLEHQKFLPDMDGNTGVRNILVNREGLTNANRPKVQDDIVIDLLRGILMELQILNTHQELITDEIIMEDEVER